MAKLKAKKIEESLVSEAPGDCKQPAECSAPECDCKPSLKERRAARQADKDRVREAPLKSVMSDEEFAESVKIQVAKPSKKS